MSIFHLAYHVDDLTRARAFYGAILGCTEGRSTETWVDFNFFGHQISLHLGPVWSSDNTGKVGGILVPMPHLGVILPQDEWQLLADHLVAAEVDFTLPPTTRFAGQAGEQSTMFFHDPAGNPIEIKGFADMAGIFAT